MLIPSSHFSTRPGQVQMTLGCKDPVEQARAAKANNPRRRHTAELFAAWWEHHKDRPMAAAKLAEPVLTLIDPHGRGRQYVATRLMQMDGTRAGGFVLTRQPPAGKWTAATYRLGQTETNATEGTRHRRHRTHGAQTAPDQPPVRPMDPMPDEVRDDEKEGWL